MKDPWKIVCLSVVTLFIGACRAILASQTEVCNQNGIQQCETSASDLSKDPSLVYPDDNASLDRACSTWNDFTTCIYKYTNRCLTQTEKSRFNQSFKEPVMAMSTLCQDKNYRKEYLNYAPCIKRIATEESNCGLQYRFLIDLFSGNTATMKQLCCAREKLKKCIYLKTPDKCVKEEILASTSTEKINVTIFAIKILDKSLAFIPQQCSYASIKLDDCPGIDSINNGNGQTFVRLNSKGPLQQNAIKDSELQSAASNEKTRQSNTTDFKIGKRPPSTSTSTTSSSISNFQLGQSQKALPSTSNSAKLNSSPGSKPQAEPEPEQQAETEYSPKPGELSGGNKGDGGVGHILPHSFLSLTLTALFTSIFMYCFKY